MELLVLLARLFSLMLVERGGSNYQPSVQLMARLILIIPYSIKVVTSQKAK